MSPTRTLLALSLIAPATAFAAPLSATGSETAIGISMSGMNQDLTVAGIKASSDTVLVGAYGRMQRGAAFRTEGRLLLGTQEVDASGSEDSASATVIELRSTWGTKLDNGDRLYAGLGIEHADGASASGNGDATASLLYVPIGITSAKDWNSNWRTAVSVEGQLLLISRSSIDNVVGTGDETFTSVGGAGLRIAADFRPRNSGFTISPFFRATATTDSQTETVNGVDVQLEDQSSVELGVHAHWSF